VSNIKKHQWYPYFEILKRSHPKAEYPGDPYLEGNKLFLSDKPFDKIDLSESDFKYKTYSVAFDNLGAVGVRIVYFDFLTLEDVKYYKDILSSWCFSKKEKLIISGDRLFQISSAVETTDAYGVPMLEDVLEVNYSRNRAQRLSDISNVAFHFDEIKEDNKQTLYLQNNHLFMTLYENGK
jgi:hypothetical protein